MSYQTLLFEIRDGIAFVTVKSIVPTSSTP